MTTKQFASVEVKDADKGEIQAVFSTFDVVDKDFDVVKAGAFSGGAPVRISAYGHQSWMGALPVGKGVIRTTGTEAILDGKFFMDTSVGRDTFTVVKEMGDLQEWSYGYDPVKFSFGEVDGQKVRFLEQIHVDEVSPVLIGAGVNTRTLAAKGAPAKYLEHAAAVITDVRQLIERTEEVKASRVAEGKGPLAERSVELLGWLSDDLVRLKSLLEPEPEIEPIHIDELARREYARFVAITQGVHA